MRAGAVLPLAPHIAVGVGVKLDHVANGAKRLFNLNGTFANTTGDADIDSLVAELTVLLKLPGNVTGRVSGYAGRAERNINLKIGGVSALNFTDKVDVTGFGFGLAAPASNFFPNMPNNLCLNAGVDIMRYGGASGLSPTGVPIQLGSFNQVSVRIGATIPIVLTVLPSITDPNASPSCP